MYNHILYILIVIIIAVVVYFLLQEDGHEQFIPHNYPVYINPNASKACKSIVQDFDEIDLNEIKKQDSKIDEILIEKPIKNKKLVKVTTYLESPWYKSYNLEDLNKYELSDNNNGLINYVPNNPKESFKAKNSLIRY